MRDQATELRELVRQVASTEPPASRTTPIIAVSGGKGGVGTTTVAVNLAVSLARQGHAIALVDADADGGCDVAALCGVEGRHSVADVAAGRVALQEALVVGPEGISLLAGVWASGRPKEWTPAGQQRLIGALQHLEGHAAVVLDVGSGLGRVVHRFWQAADEVLLVTTSEPVAIMDAYAAIKILRIGEAAPPVRLVVNSVASRQVGDDVYGRISQSCRRFLGMELDYAGPIPADPRVTASGSDVVGATSSGAARAFDALALGIVCLANVDATVRHAVLSRGESTIGSSRAA